MKITSVTLLNEKFVLIISLSVDITAAFNRPTLWITRQILLTLSWQRPLSYRNHSIDLLWKSLEKIFGQKNSTIILLQKSILQKVLHWWKYFVSTQKRVALILSRFGTTISFDINYRSLTILILALTFDTIALTFDTIVLIIYASIEKMRIVVFILMTEIN